MVNPSVIDQLAKTREAKQEYDRLMSQRLGLQLTFALMYGVVSFVFLLAAIWTGLWFSDRLVAPIVRLLDASRRVTAGQLDAKVDVIEGPPDLQTLSSTFNLMTGRIKRSVTNWWKPRKPLMTAGASPRQCWLDVSAGVIGIDPRRQHLARESICPHSSVDDGRGSDGQASSRCAAALPGRVRAGLVPAVGVLGRPGRPTASWRKQELLRRVTTEAADAKQHGHVLTFDDITDLVSAQRNSAWADIARRIAHEIKNPLTPIQLSAERLKRKYSKQITNDKQVFDQCTDTIIRQVGDIGRMVDEFSSFARMPSPRRSRKTLPPWCGRPRSSACVLFRHRY